MINGLFEKTGVNLMKKVLSISSQRQRVIASNIANALTSGYIKKELNFEENLAQAMGKKGINGLANDRRHLPLGNKNKGSQPFIIKNDAQSAGVDMEKEMAASAENQLLYSTVTKLISGRFRSIRMVIRGRV